jgi:exopolysaccharide biosynthesis protein
VLVERGKKVVETQSKFSTTRHPRTAVGVSDGGRKLILVVVDGRKPERSVGLSLDELAELILQLGCDDALNLDGGGSSTLVLRNPQTNELVTVNSPSDGKQRPVANVLGVDLDGARNPTTQGAAR